MKQHWTTFVIIMAVCAVLAGCAPGGMAFSPQQAALRAVTDGNGRVGIVDPSSVLVRQSVSIDDRTFVMVSFTEQVNNMLNQCTFVHETQRSGIGTWQTRGGGGGCTNVPDGQEPPAQEVEIGNGWNGGDRPNDPGYSQTYGLVNRKDIAKVRVIWADGQQNESAVVNGSYMTVRAGQFGFKKVEGINESGSVVFTFESEPPPPGMP